jgi:hypothetical protein
MEDKRSGSFETSSLRGPLGADVPLEEPMARSSGVGGSPAVSGVDALEKSVNRRSTRSNPSRVLFRESTATRSLSSAPIQVEPMILSSWLRA